MRHVLGINFLCRTVVWCIILLRIVKKTWLSPISDSDFTLLCRLNRGRQCRAGEALGAGAVTDGLQTFAMDVASYQEQSLLSPGILRVIGRNREKMIETFGID
jgi:hypothetical protein